VILKVSAQAMIRVPPPLPVTLSSIFIAAGTNHDLCIEKRALFSILLTSS
jgi:hypothetical protein